MNNAIKINPVMNDMWRNKLLNDAQEQQDIHSSLKRYLNAFGIERYQSIFFPAQSVFDTSATEYICGGYENFPDIPNAVVKFFSSPSRAAFLRQSIKNMVQPFYGANRLFDEMLEIGETMPDTIMAGASKTGLIIPVFGPKSYVGIFGLAVNPEDLGASQYRDVSTTCQSFFQIYCNYDISRTTPMISLNDRESEVLKWLSLGKTNQVIGNIIGVSKHTVDAYIRRIFLKLRVNDRVSAAMKANDLGLCFFRTDESKT